MFDPEVRDGLLRLRLEAPELFGQPADQSAVRALCAELSCELSASYRQFLLEFGSATVGGLHLTGLHPPELMGSMTVLELTAHGRRELGPIIGEDLYVFSDDGRGNHVFSHCGDDAVRMYDHDVGDLRVLAPRFDRFVGELLRGGAPCG